MTFFSFKSTRISILKLRTKKPSPFWLSVFPDQQAVFLPHPKVDGCRCSSYARRQSFLESYPALIHSVDTPDLAEAISRRSAAAGVVTNILLQVNTSGESAKHGLSPQQWLKAFPHVSTLPNIAIQGLMTMAPLTDEAAIIRECFANLRLFRDELNADFPNNRPLKHLSMGMSNDFAIAIEEGATIVRIGTSIFATG